MVQSVKKIEKLALPALTLLALCFASVSLAQTNPGENLFKSKCASCHGPDGAAKTTMGTMLKIRDLSSANAQKQTDAELTQIITKGKNKMPSFDGKLKKGQVDELVVFIRHLTKK